MKLKSLLIGSALMLPLAAFAANPFSGAYAGLETGFQTVTFSHSGSTDAGKGSWAAGVLGGYNFAFDDNWLLGAQAYYDFNNAKVHDSGGNGTTAKLNRTYGIDALLGYAFSQNDAVYIGPGWVRGRVTGSSTYAAGANKKGVNGYRGVVVAQQMLTDNLSLKESMAYEKFKKVGGSKPKLWSAMLGLSYGFNV